MGTTIDNREIKCIEIIQNRCIRFHNLNIGLFNNAQYIRRLCFEADPVYLLQLDDFNQR